MWFVIIGVIHILFRAAVTPFYQPGGTKAFLGSIQPMLVIHWVKEMR